MNAWWQNTLMNLKLTFRDRQAIFWTYLFPLFFLFLFSSVLARGQRGMVANLLPGLLCISAMSAGLFGLSIGLVTARERGILRRYQLAPFNPWMLISSELAANFVVALSTLLLQLILAKVVYQVNYRGQPLAFFVMLSAGVLAFQAIGFIVAAVAENAKSAQVLSNLLFFPLMFLGGAAFPLAMLPPAVRKFSHFLPSQYMVNGLAGVMVEGEGLRANALNLAVLSSVCVLALWLAVRLFRWEAKTPLPWRQKAWVLLLGGVFVLAAWWQ